MRQIDVKRALGIDTSKIDIMYNSMRLKGLSRMKIESILKCLVQKQYTDDAMLHRSGIIKWGCAIRVDKGIYDLESVILSVAVMNNCTKEEARMLISSRLSDTLVDRKELLEGHISTAREAIKKYKDNIARYAIELEELMYLLK